jgi:hypothetical protein
MQLKLFHFVTNKQSSLGTTAKSFLYSCNTRIKLQGVRFWLNNYFENLHGHQGLSDSLYLHLFPVKLIKLVRKTRLAIRLIFLKLLLTY